MIIVTLSELVVSVLAGSNLAEDDGFLRAVKMHSVTSFVGEVKPSTPCHKIL
jgi:hypothetical protein